MAIELKTNPEDVTRSSLADMESDCIAAHALLLAMREADDKWKAQRGQREWMLVRAAHHHNRMIRGE